MTRSIRLRWRVIGLPLFALAQALMAQTTTAQFPVQITLLPPPGCTGSSAVGSQTGTPQVTLTCGANLLVNVRPVLVSLGSGQPGPGSTPPSSAAPGTAGTESPGTGNAGVGTPVPGGVNLPGGGMRFGPNAGPEGANPLVVDGVLFFYVIASPPGVDTASEIRPWSANQMALSAQSWIWSLQPGTALEMWMNF